MKPCAGSMVIVAIFSGSNGRFLDVHAAFGRDDHGDTAGGAIDDHRQVVFLAMSTPSVT
jgi:hypothetical protein